jgi:hypothetical protein
MGSVIFVLLPIALLVIVGLAAAMFFESALAGPARRLFPNRKPGLPLLSGAALRSWASGQAQQVVAEYSRSLTSPAAPIELARELENFTTRVIDETASERRGRSDDRCDQEKRQIVPVSAPETLAMVDQLQRQLSRGELEALRERAGVNAIQIATGVGSAKSAVPPACPLMADNGRCLCFEARPVHCRGQCFTAADGGIGATTVTNAAPNEFALAVREGVASGLAAGLHLANRDAQCYELNSALARALGVSNVAARWSRGEAVFEGCRVEA